MMKTQVLLAFLLIVGAANCQQLVLQGRPLLGGVKAWGTNAIKKELKHELKVAASADEIWSVYGSPQLCKLLTDLLPGAFEDVEIIGDGGVGTILHLTFPPGEFPHEYKEKFVVVDDKRRLLKVEIIEGGYLDLGVTYYMSTIHVVPTGSGSCVLKSSTEYHVKPEFEKVVEPLITTVPVASMAEAIAKFVLDNKTHSITI